MKDLRLSESQQKLLLENHNMIYDALSKKGYEVEEFYDLAVIGLAKAICIFDSSKGKLSTIAYRCIYNEINCYLRSEKKCVSTISLEENFAECKDEELLLKDSLSEGDNKLEHIEDYITIENKLNKLTIIDLYILKCRLDGKSYEDVANELGVSRQRVGARISDLKKNFCSDATMHRKVKENYEILKGTTKEDLIKYILDKI